MFGTLKFITNFACSKVDLMARRIILLFTCFFVLFSGVFSTMQATGALFAEKAALTKENSQNQDKEDHSQSQVKLVNLATQSAQPFHIVKVALLFPDWCLPTQTIFFADVLAYKARCLRATTSQTDLALLPAILRVFLYYTAPNAP